MYRRGRAPARAAEREVAALRALDHPRIPRLAASFGHADRRIVLIDLVGGPSLREHVEAHGPLAPERVRVLSDELREALGHVHARGFVFRDLHPRNVHLDPGKGAILLDFDGARPVGSRGSPGGRIGYRAPELALRRRLTPAADVYALAGCLYFALTGDDPPAETGPLGFLSLDAARVADPRGRPPLAALRFVH